MERSSSVIVFGEMRLKKSVRSLRLLMSLRLLRFLKPGNLSDCRVNAVFLFLEAKEAIEASDVIMSVETIEATEVFRTTESLEINNRKARIASF